ncbi:ras guanine nucleotide exchange factor V-like [Durio zibethinus]|uniref:Ras guanine nucleotide exchange factor V-like n=1 Tax=Durio zibethinus TaxID=66656 RepID=A0A6P5ZIN5_DURZI|nr:ras guanine nucleotide exchange factor V-like [Durio zibethinus]
MGSLRSWTGDRVEAVDDKGGDGSRKQLTDFEVNNNEVKPLSRHGTLAFSSSSDSSQDPELKSPAHFRVSFAGSTELFPENHMPSGQVAGGYVPNRIPSSVFSSKPATPMDWSTASNESLFSIHIGNGSFSRDQFFMLHKSGELTKLDEQIIAQGHLLPSLKELEDMARRNENIDKDSEATEMSKNTTAKVVETSEVAEDRSNQKMPLAEEVHNPISNTPTVDLGSVAGNNSQEKKFPAEVHNSPTNSISGHSDGCKNGTLSFAFPVLTGTSDAGTFSHVNGDQNNKGLQAQSVKQQKQQQEEEQDQKQSTEELQPQIPVTPQNAYRRSWFSCFYCCRCS